MKRVNEILTVDVSFFGTMQTSFNTLYTELFGDVTPTEMDIQLLINCGERYASPLLCSQDVTTAVAFCVNRFSNSWSRIRKALFAEYDATKPYNLKQTTTTEKEATRNDNGESTEKNGVVGFDSETATDSEVTTNTNESNATETETGSTTVINEGNLGNVANSELIANEIEVRKISFIELVIKDIQAQITLAIY